MKKLISIACAISMSLTASADKFSQDTDIDDLALIYIGAQHRPYWNKNLFEPYVVHTFADGSQSWMFDGFLMLDFMIWNDEDVPVSFGEFNAGPADKDDWEALLVNQLGVKDGLGCRALDEVIGDYIEILGEPEHKHKVVFSVPLPVGFGQTWGKIDGRPLNFAIFEDRVKAMNWYIDLILKYWKEQNFQYLELDGIYWTKEAFNEADGNLAKSVNQYCHKKGLRSYWIPYFTADGRDRWKEFGMDVAYLQPNYYFNLNTPKEQLYAATEYAWEHELNLEMEFEGFNYDKNKAQYAPDNIGLYNFSEDSKKFYQRLVDYIDRFEEDAVFDFLPVAYYSGFSAVFDFVNSSHAKDKEVMHRLASILKKRHEVTGWYNVDGIEDAMFGDNVTVYGVDGGIYIADEAGNDVAVYSLDGRTVYNRTCDESERLAYGITVACERGVYVVRIGERSIKVLVK